MSRDLFKEKKPKPIISIGQILGVFMFLWVLGFGYFLGRLPLPPTAALSGDAIAVLTGGAGRVELAARLLKDRKAPLLLVSGVHEVANANNIPALKSLENAQIACCVTLGREAMDTRGNAREVTQFVRAHGVKRLIVVTSDYHMPRSMLLLRAALPDIELHPYRVESPLAPLYLLSEYHKFLVTLLTLAVE